MQKLSRSCSRTALPLVRISPWLPTRFGARGLSLPCWRTTSTGSLPRKPPQVPRQAGHRGLLAHHHTAASAPSPQGAPHLWAAITAMGTEPALPSSNFHMDAFTCGPAPRQGPEARQLLPLHSHKYIRVFVIWQRINTYSQFGNIFGAFLCPVGCTSSFLFLCGLRPAKDQRLIRVKIKFSLIETYNGLIM